MSNVRFGRKCRVATTLPQADEGRYTNSLPLLSSILSFRLPSAHTVHNSTFSVCFLASVKMSDPPYEKGTTRRASKTAVDAGLSSEDDAAMLGKIQSFEPQERRTLTSSKPSLVTSRRYVVLLQPQLQSLTLQQATTKLHHDRSLRDCIRHHWPVALNSSDTRVFHPVWTSRHGLVVVSGVYVHLHRRPGNGGPRVSYADVW
jgi:hypothetical protein